MENREELFDALNDFEKKPSKEIPPLLDQFLREVAKTGETLFPWPRLKPLFVSKLDQVMMEFQQEFPDDTSPLNPNLEHVQFHDMHARIISTVERFHGAPFTIQRLCELITDPKRHYKRSDKFLRGIEKNVLVVSTVDPFGKKVVSDMRHLVNGLDTNGCTPTPVTLPHPPVPAWPASSAGHTPTPAPTTTTAWPQSQADSDQLGQSNGSQQECSQPVEESAQPVERCVQPAEERVQPAEEQAQVEEERVQVEEEQAQPAEEHDQLAEERVQPAEERAQVEEERAQVEEERAQVEEEQAQLEAAGAQPERVCVQPVLEDARPEAEHKHSLEDRLEDVQQSDASESAGPDTGPGSEADQEMSVQGEEEDQEMRPEPEELPSQPPEEDKPPLPFKPDSDVSSSAVSQTDAVSTAESDQSDTKAAFAQMESREATPCESSSNEEERDDSPPLKMARVEESEIKNVADSSPDPVTQSSSNNDSEVTGDSSSIAVLALSDRTQVSSSDTPPPTSHCDTQNISQTEGSSSPSPPRQESVQSSTDRQGHVRCDTSPRDTSLQRCDTSPRDTDSSHLHDEPSPSRDCSDTEPSVMADSGDSVVAAASSENVAASSDNVAASSDHVAASSDDVAASSDNVAASSDNVAASSDNIAAISDSASVSSDSAEATVSDSTTTCEQTIRDGQSHPCEKSDAVDSTEQAMDTDMVAAESSEKSEGTSRAVEAEEPMDED